DAENPMVLLFRHVNAAPPPPRTINPDLDPRLAAWIERMLEKEPGDRPADATHAFDELEEIVIALAGPTWRRPARLTSPVKGSAAPPKDAPLTPAEFPSEYESFAPGRAAPQTPPPADSEPDIFAPTPPPFVPEEYDEEEEYEDEYEETATEQP